MKPWEVDYTVHPIPWREEAFEDASTSKSLRIGLMESDGVCEPSPAIARALSETAAALTAAGHTVVPIPVSSFPSQATPAYGLQIASLLLCADGGKTFKSFFRTGETMDKGAAQIYSYMGLPRWIKYMWYLYTRYIRRDALWASILRYFHPMSAFEQWKWVAKREAYRNTWFEWWSNSERDFDFILCPGNATPALPHGCMHDAVSSCGYTFLWNLLDYSAGIIPVTKVDAVKDALPSDFKPSNGVEAGAYKHYDSKAMEGLPCAVQVVGRRLTEEKTLGCMKVVEDALKESGIVYEQLDIEKVMQTNSEAAQEKQRRGSFVEVDAKRIW
jgi:Asp-tRNA(Asn)/Glu-tRNA(Gln) amidotransferase A subunit family amidase